MMGPDSRWDAWERRCLNRLLTGQHPTQSGELSFLQDELSRAVHSGLGACRTRAQVQTVFEAARSLAFDGTPFDEALYLERANPYRAADGKYTNGPHKTKAYAAVRREKIRDLKRRAEVDAYEYAYAVSRDTGEVFKARRGTETNVLFDPAEIVGRRDVALLHSHPNVVALSGGDWDALLEHSNISEVTAVNTKYTATILKPPFWRKPRDKSVPPDPIVEWTRLFHKLAQPYFSGEKNLSEMSEEEESQLTIEINKQLAVTYRIIFHVDHHTL